ncbi:MAG: hypothetical protein C4560_02975 [Nitrospiraceae bacterium]|nr:MAG: hypothetical protein C4560_02975 [Nitrospiraceae bacterium]
MSPFIQFTCGCIEGPAPAEKCWQHGQPVRGAFTGVKNIPQRGVAQYLDCVMGRPIKIWISNNLCDGASICPSKYDCQHKKPRRQEKLL